MDTAPAPTPDPLVRLFQVLPDAPAPVPAGERARGALPSKALKFCPPVVGAASLGWHIFPAFDMTLRFDGIQTDVKGPDGIWQRVPVGQEATWQPWTDHYRTAYPDWFLADLADDTPGLYNADPYAPNRIEMYTGVVARTAPGWALQVRTPANVPPRHDYRLYEGIIETAWQVSMLPTVLELPSVGAEVTLSTAMPLAQLQLVPTQFLHQAPEAVIGDLGDVDDDTFAAWHSTRLRRTTQERSGGYRRETKARQRAIEQGGCPLGHS